MDEIRDIGQLFEDEELRLLSERESTRKTYSVSTTNVEMAGTLIAI